MSHGLNVRMLVKSLALAAAEPPPITLTWLVTEPDGVPVTLTVTVRGYELPVERASLRVQASVAKVQVQPVPPIPVAVRPPGSASVTVTVPLLGPESALITVMVYTAPVCPRATLPTCVLVTIRTA